MRLPIGAASLAAAVLIAGCDSGRVPSDVSPQASSSAAAPVRSAAPPVAADVAAAETAAVSTPADPVTGAPAGIDWFAGGIDAAFAEARTANEPVLLYWGAEWCPYCADLEAHVFSREDVQRKLELFVPVYLDGDDAGAQRWAETFGVAGYPTVLALAPDRTELARIAGGMDITVYADMLDLVLGDVRPIDDVLRAGEAGTLSADDCRRLAYNGWPLDDAASERTSRLAATLAAAAEACSGDVERARLAAYAVSFAVAAEGRDASQIAERLLPRVREIVAKHELAVSIADVLRELDERYFEVAKLADPEGVRGLLDDWVAVMESASTDPRFGQGDRLAAVSSKVDAIAALDPEGISEAAVEDARRRVDEAFADVGRSPARRGTANAAINLLVAVGDIDQARSIAERELELSPTPYYQMADLAWLDEMLGRYGDAPDRLYRRSRARLETLDASLRDWNANGEHDDAIAALRDRMAEICRAIPADEQGALESCAAFLSAGTASA